MESSGRRSAVLPRPIPGTPPFPAVPRAERFALENGLRIVAVHRGDLPQIAGRLVVPVGSAGDPVGQPGTAAFVASLLAEGTETLEVMQLHERIDALGASLGARAGHDFTEIDIGLLAETLDEGLRLLAEVAARPTFPDREVERVRAELLDALEARLDEPANVADDHTSEAVFGADHPYGRLPLGTVSGVASLRRETLQAFHRFFYRPTGSVFIIAGDLSGEDLRGRLEQAFGGWEGMSARFDYPTARSAPVASDRLSSLEWPDAAQAELRVAGIGMPRASPDWIPGAVANFILGGSTITGRLGANLREDKGWTYGVRSGFAAGVHSGGWVVETAVEAGAAADAIGEIERELDLIVHAPVEAEELERAKEALILSLPRAFETPGRVVARLATVEAFGLPADYWDRFPGQVRRVDPDDVRRVAERYFDPSRLIRVSVGPPLGAASQLTS